MAQPSLSDLLRAGRPEVATGAALLAIDLQNDFVGGSEIGKLPVVLLQGFVADFGTLISTFRKSGPVIWLHTEYNPTYDLQDDSVIVQHYTSPSEIAPDMEGSDVEEGSDDSEEELLRNSLSANNSPLANRASARRTAEVLVQAARRSRLDRNQEQEYKASDDLFLAKRDSESRQCCRANSHGAELAPFVKSLQDDAKDHIIKKHGYSAFNGTTLLKSLRLRLVTRIYLSGALSNVSVHATAADAVAHGFHVTIVDDCLGYVSRNCHERALRYMRDVIGADCVSASELIAELTSDADLRVDSRHEMVGTEIDETTTTGQMAKLELESDSSPHVVHGDEDSPEPSDLAKASRPEQVQPEYPAVVQLDVAESEETASRYAAAIRAPETSGPLSPDQYPISTFQDENVAVSRAHNNYAVNQSPSQAQIVGTSKASTAIMSPGDPIGAGDSSIIYELMEESREGWFATIKNEVQWQRMLHAHGEVPRLVCVQGAFGEDGSMPVYRHPADQSLPLLHFSPGVKMIKNDVEKRVGHAMNHVLIQLYRNGEDYISEHSDKTLDIVRGSSIVNVSLGAQRTMRLRTKRPRQAEASEIAESVRQTQLIPMPHRSMFALGPETNRAWLHGINHDKRPAAQRTDNERAFGGERISLTFRHIGTYLDSESKYIWGQGASNKDKEGAKPVINGDERRTKEVINAFGYENQQTSFNWDSVYGHGFDVLHFTSAPEESPLLFVSGDHLTDLKVKIFLEELRVPFRTTGVLPSEAGIDYAPQICFRDTDTQKTQVYGSVPILLYLARSDTQRSVSPDFIAEECSQLEKLHDILSTALPDASLSRLEQLLKGRQFVAGNAFSAADCAYWPLLGEILKKWQSWDTKELPHVAAYHEIMLNYPSVRKVTQGDTA